MANQPEFNPNNTKKLEIGTTKNHSIRSLFEPASVTKPLIIAYALEHGVVGRNQPHNCEMGAYAVDGQSTIHDEYPSDYLTTEETIIHSSNICTYKIAQELGKQRSYKALRTFGIGDATPSPLLVHAKKGYISHPNQWREIRFANISFGQGFHTTGLEIIKAYSALANGGFLVEPYLLERIETPNKNILVSSKSFPTRSIISRETSRTMREILYHAVEEGTGKNAKLKHFSSAGKTGTAEKYSIQERKYSRKKRIASFAGFAPAISPHLVAYIVIDEPQKKPYYGGVWAAPVFKAIMDQALKYLNIASENKQELPKLQWTENKDNDTKNKTKF